MSFLNRIFGSTKHQRHLSQHERQHILSDAKKLLQKTDKSRVRIDKSTIPNAGNGVYTATPVKKHEALCFYPGEYSPPLPDSFISGIANEHSTPVYLAKDSHDFDLEENAYVMNLQDVGGYIIGDVDQINSDGNQDTIDSIEYASGHLVNHPSKQLDQSANVRILSFLWDDILEEDIEDENLHQIPTHVRTDGSAWYLDPNEGSITHFSEKQHSVNQTKLAGAVLYAEKDIETNQELFLDYQLQSPFPSWAKDWAEQ